MNHYMQGVSSGSVEGSDSSITCHITDMLWKVITYII